MSKETQTSSPVTASPVSEPVRRDVCANCGGLLGEGDFCPVCGQRKRSGRLTFRGMTQKAVSDGFSLNRGFLRTVGTLTRRPGRVPRDFVEGRTVPYTSPVRYFLICLAVAQLVAFWTEAIQGFAEGFSEGNRDVAISAHEGSRLLRDYFVLMAAGALPIVVFATRILMVRRRFNLAEHSVFHLYTAGHSALCFAVGVALATALPDVAEGPVATLVLVGMFVYYVFSVRSFFEVSRLGAFASSVLAFGLGALAYGLLMAALLTLSTPGGS